MKTRSPMLVSMGLSASTSYAHRLRYFVRGRSTAAKQPSSRTALKCMCVGLGVCRCCFFYFWPHRNVVHASIHIRNVGCVFCWLANGFWANVFPIHSSSAGILWLHFSALKALRIVLLDRILIEEEGAALMINTWKLNDEWESNKFSFPQ